MGHRSAARRTARRRLRQHPRGGRLVSGGVLVFEGLKKCRGGIYRTVPAPPALLETLNMVHGIRELLDRRGKGRGVRLWPWSRMTGWRAVHAVMAAVRLDGPHASPKGLRHGFGVAAVSAGIPLNLVQKWLGHAQPPPSTPTPSVPRKRIPPDACGVGGISASQRPSSRRVHWRTIQPSTDRLVIPAYGITRDLRHTVIRYELRPYCELCPIMVKTV
jgi:integrase/recombinase XerD